MEQATSQSASDGIVTVDPSGYGAEGRSEWFDVAWQNHQRWITIDGKPANVIDIGNGPPVLCVHGLSGCWQNWLENIPHLAKHHRVIVPDLPGFGCSSMPNAPISMEFYADFLAKLLGEFGLTKAVVIGNSMGGLISAEFALRHPDKLSKLVLVDAAGISVEALEIGPYLGVLKVLQPINRMTVRMREQVALRPGSRKVALKLVCDRPELLTAEMANELIKGAAKPGFDSALLAILDHKISQRIEQITAPTLVVWGTRDKIIPVRDARVFAERIPNAQAILYRKTGHVPMIEQPALFNSAVSEFIDA